MSIAIRRAASAGFRPSIADVGDAVPLRVGAADSRMTMSDTRPGCPASSIPGRSPMRITAHLRAEPFADFVADRHAPLLDDHNRRESANPSSEGQKRIESAECVAMHGGRGEPIGEDKRRIPIAARSVLRIQDAAGVPRSGRRRYVSAIARRAMHRPAA